MKTAHLVSDFCVDIEFQKDPKANRNTALALFECAANYTSLELVEYGQARVNEISRNALIRLVQKTDRRLKKTPSPFEPGVCHLIIYCFRKSAIARITLAMPTPVGRRI